MGAGYSGIVKTDTLVAMLSVGALGLGQTYKLQD